MGELITVCPSDEVRFKSNACKAHFTIANASRCPVAFKIKTTSPEKFQVRPSTDVIQCGCSATVQVSLCEGVAACDVADDKFLVVATPVRGSVCNRNQLRRLWRCVRREQRYEHQLCCVVESSGETCGGGGGGSPSGGNQLRCLAEKLDCLTERLCCRERLAERSARIQEQNRRLITLSFYLIAALAVANGVFLLLAYRAFGNCAGGLVIGLVRRTAPSCTTLFSWLS